MSCLSEFFKVENLKYTSVNGIHYHGIEMVKEEVE
jgi:hypothetical protein